MKTTYESISLDQNGNLSDSNLIEKIIRIEIAEFDHFSINRSQRRKEQSIAARELLDRTLKELFPRKVNDCWTLDKTENGKPFLKGSNAPSISITHSGDWVACAISSLPSIGIDLEVIKPRNWDLYFKDILHPEESQWVSKGVGREQDIRGLICWCRKEAIVKAIGLGLVYPLSEIGCSPEGNIISLPKELGAFALWKFHTSVIFEKAVVSVAWKNESEHNLG